MLNPRNAILASLGLFVLWFANATWQTLSPEMSRGRGTDTFGTRHKGQRGLYETLAALQIPVGRQLTPPGDDLPTDLTLVLLLPDRMLTGFEPRPLRQLMTWVERGGRVVLAPPVPLEPESLEAEQFKELEHFEGNILQSLGIEGVRVEEQVSWKRPGQTVPGRPDLTLLEVLSSSEPGGNATSQSQSLRLATAAENLHSIEQDAAATARVHTAVLDRAGDSWTVAVTVPRGAGEIVILSEPSLLSNVSLLHGDNAVWAVQLVTDGGTRAVRFDEFYHGLSVRGNYFWLLTKPQYLFPLLMTLLWIGLSTWRSGVLLGPPLASQDPSRRTITEYISSMARLFCRSSNGAKFLLEQQRDGVWRTLCQEARLPSGSTEVEAVVAIIARHDPHRAERIRSAFLSCDSLRSLGQITFAEVQQPMAALTDCRRERTPGPVSELTAGPQR